MAEFEEDSNYCVLCGEEDRKDLYLHPCPTTARDRTEILCLECCDNASLEHWDHQILYPDDPLDYHEFFKLAYPDRMLLLDLTEEELRTYQQAAESIGLTLDEFIVDCLKISLNNEGEKK